MIRRKFGLLALAAGLALASVPAARADAMQDIKARGVLAVGVKADYPPFGFRTPDGRIVGIEPDLARDVAKRLGVKLQLVPVTGANRMPFLEQGKIDMIIATMNDTPAREKVIDFVKPDYYASGYNMMLPKTTKLAAWNQLKGKPVCGVQGAFYNKPVAEKYGANVIAFPGVTEALAALKQGRCIGLLFDDTAIEGQLISPEWKNYAMPLPTQDAQPWGLAVRKGETKFAAFMARTIEDWDRTGLILKLETRYGIDGHSKFAEEMHEKYR